MTGPQADRAGLHPKANEVLDQNLAPGETVKVVIVGPSSQAIIGTKLRAFVYKKGFMAGATLGSELTSWDYRTIVGVQMHTGMLNGAVVLQVPGHAGSNTSIWKGHDGNPYQAPNAIPVQRPWGRVTEGVALLRHLIHDAQSALAQAPVVGSAASDPIQQIQQLADLHAAGALTEAEFETKKAELLRRI